MAVSPAPVVLTTSLGLAAATHSAVELHLDRTDERATPATAKRSGPALTAYASRARRHHGDGASIIDQTSSAFLDQIIVARSRDCERRGQVVDARSGDVDVGHDSGEDLAPVHRGRSGPWIDHGQVERRSDLSTASLFQQIEQGVASSASSAGSSGG